jgi:diaminopimelate decarboxylase
MSSSLFLSRSLRLSSSDLKFESVSLLKLAQKHQTPLYVYSKKDFLSPFLSLKKELRSLKTLVSFAVKSNSNLHLLRLLAQKGAGMDLVSGGELKRALLAGTPPERMVFSGIGKTEEEIRLGLKLGIHSFNVESEEELIKIATLASKLKTKAPIVLRFNPDVNPKTHPYISTGLDRNKFGLNRRELSSILPLFQKYSSLKLTGLSMHIGSQILSLAPFEESFIKLKELCLEIEAKFQLSLEFLDLGGGLGIPYSPKQTCVSIFQYCRLILKHFGPGSGFEGKTIGLEPGRLISGNSGVLMTQILYKKVRKHTTYLIVDAAMNDLMRPSLYQSHHEITPLYSGLTRRSPLSGKTPNQKYAVVGPVCESSDVFRVDVRLPIDLKQGDYLVIHSAGAYGMSMSSQYNSRPRAAEVLVAGSQHRLIRMRETFEDLIHNELL